jgi:2'-5' RNA ligase
MEKSCNYFFALLPDREAVTSISRLSLHLRLNYGMTGNPIADERLHVSLYGFGSRIAPSQKILGQLSHAADVAAAFTPPFEIRFDCALSYSRKNAKKAFVLASSVPTPGFQSLHDALGSALSHYDLGHDLWKSRDPHLTLVYDQQMIPRESVAAVHWLAGEFVLIKSYVGESKYELLGRWRLAG